MIELQGILESEQIETGLPPGSNLGDQVTLAVRPENITISAKPIGAGIRGRMVRRVYLGNQVDYRGATGNVEIRVTTDTTEEDLPEGTDVWIVFKKVFAFKM